MDEASLMPQDAFSVLIGRLREAGEQGWLSATFTPKGRAHWTFETFATGRPDTALFHARTADNPFLPSGFHATVARQYSSTLAAQELEGQFLDAGGMMFRRHWFPVVDAAPPLRASVRTWDLAATPRDESKANDPDWTAGVLMGKGRDGCHYLLGVRRTRATPQAVEELVKRTAVADGRAVTIYMEQEPGSAGVAVISYYLRLLAGFSFHGVRSTGSKADRAQPLAAQAEGGLVKLLRGAWNRDFLDEAELFPFGPHDDVLDAASLALSKLAWVPTSPGVGGIVLSAGKCDPYGYGDAGAAGAWAAIEAGTLKDWSNAGQGNRWGYLGGPGGQPGRGDYFTP
jgi:predicted phage terminase large subunit-like protein